MTDRPTVDVRPACRGDAPALFQLVKALAAYENLADEVTGTEADLSRALFGPDAIAEAAIIWDDGEPAGYALWYETFSTFRGRKGLYLEDLFVVPARRGRGLGKALLRHVAEVALSRSYSRLEWEVLGWNEPAIAFYERLGGKWNDRWLVYTLDGQAVNRLAEPEVPTTADGG